MPNHQQEPYRYDTDEELCTTSHLGNIAFNGLTYNLPTSLVAFNATVSNGQYNIRFTPSNASYQFMWWDLSGDIILTGPNSDNTTIELQGKGNITAIYAFMVEPPHSIGGTFFVDSHGSKDFWLVPIPPDDHGHLASKASTGSGKAELNITSDPTPGLIRCEPIVSVTAYIGISPSNAPIRKLEFELGFTYDGSYYKLGYWAFIIDGVPRSRYDLFVEVNTANFPGEPYVIPEGSRINLIITATFTTPPGGTIKLFYGPELPSCVTLYH
ncbi:MAG TPA: hypothetical protein VJ507_03410 [Candidatus Bathyarchaeia archaeon]|nr:hypothetical protein [Candidatus Bathyarchaeia archaeon]